MNKLLTVRTLALLIGGLFVLTAAMALMFTSIAYRGAAHGAAPGVVLHPRRVETPFTLRRGIKPSEFASTLRQPVYPGSVADESVTNRWIPTSRPKSGKGVGLALLRLRAEVGPDQVEGWYKDQLGPEFVRTQGNLAGTVHEHAEWLQRVLSNPNANAVLFLNTQATGADGVLLEPDPTSKQVVITLFRYGGARSE